MPSHRAYTEARIGPRADADCIVCPPVSLAHRQLTKTKQEHKLTRIGTIYQERPQNTRLKSESVTAHTVAVHPGSGHLVRLFSTGTLCIYRILLFYCFRAFDFHRLSVVTRGYGVALPFSACTLFLHYHYVHFASVKYSVPCPQPTEISYSVSIPRATGSRASNSCPSSAYHNLVSCPLPCAVSPSFSRLLISCTPPPPPLLSSLAWSSSSCLAAFPVLIMFHPSHNYFLFNFVLLLSCDIYRCLPGPADVLSAFFSTSTSAASSP